MGFLDKIRRRRAAADRSLPYTYEALVDILTGQGRGAVHDHYFSTTICGLVEILADAGIPPAHVSLYGVRRRQRQLLDKALLTTPDGAWREPPELCRVLEDRFARTREELYRGHVEHGTCSFADRERRGAGPVW